MGLDYSNSSLIDPSALCASHQGTEVVGHQAALLSDRWAKTGRSSLVTPYSWRAVWAGSDPAQLLQLNRQTTSGIQPGKWPDTG